jgi:hypothetical protein
LPQPPPPPPPPPLPPLLPPPLLSATPPLLNVTPPGPAAVATLVQVTLLLRNVTAQQFNASGARGAFVGALAGALNISVDGVNITHVADVPMPSPAPAVRRALRQSGGNGAALEVGVSIVAPSGAAAAALTANVTALVSGAGAVAFVATLNAALSAVGIIVASLALPPPPPAPPPPAPPPPAPPPPAPPPSPAVAASSSGRGGNAGGAAAGAVIGILLGILLLCYGVYRYALWRPDSSFSQAVLSAAASFEAAAHDVAASFMALPPVVWLQQKLTGGGGAAGDAPSKAPVGGADPFGAAPAFTKKGGGSGGGGGGAMGPPESHSRAEVATAQLLRHNNKALFKHLFGKGAPGSSPWASLTAAPALRARDVIAVAGELADVKGRTLYAKLVTLVAQFAESGAPKPCDVDWEGATHEYSEPARALIAATFFVYLLAVNEDETPYFEELSSKLAKSPSLAAKADAARDKCERLDLHALGDCLARLAGVRGEADAAEFATEYTTLLRSVAGGSSRAAPASFRDDLTGDEYETPLPQAKRAGKGRAPPPLPPVDRSSFDNSDASTLGSPRGGGGNTRRAHLVQAMETDEEAEAPRQRSTNKKKRAGSAQKRL